MTEYKKKYNECIICFEHTKNQEIPIQFNYEESYFKFCNCNPYIHSSCLKLWVNLNYDCPICRNIVIENKLYEFGYGFYIIHYTIYFYTFLKTIIKKYLFLILFYLLICIFTQIYELFIFILDEL
jgi:hypothetical protein